MDYELYHHGVLGQRWGVRRYQPYADGERVRGGKEIGEAAKVKKKRGTNKIINDPDPTKTFLYKQNRYDEDIVLKKGDYLYRADGKAQIDPKKKALYASLKNDAIGYLIAADKKQGMAMDMKVKNGNNGKPYSVKLQLQEDLIIPSYKKSVDKSTPMIVFKKGTVTQVGSKPIDEKDIEYFIDRNYGKDPLSNNSKPYTKKELEERHPGKTKSWDDWLEDRPKKK